MQGQQTSVRGVWSGDASSLSRDPARWAHALRHLRRPLFAVEQTGGIAWTHDGVAQLGAGPSEGLPLRAYAPTLTPQSLGDPGFCHEHGVSFGIVAGAMAGGIASVELVEAAARAGMLAFFGAAGLAAHTVDAAIERLQTRLLDRSFGCNLIHSPYEPQLEAEVADLYIRRGITCVSASAYLDLTLPLVRYRLHGIRRGADGRIVTPNRVVAKVSRVEVARKFFSPPPAGMLRELVAQGHLDEAQAELARQIPMAQDLTAEADSGGHTDNRPALALLPTMISLRDRLQAEHGYADPLRVGAAGGIATPASVAAAFGMGAAYVLTGSVNQACLESGTSDHVRQLLAQAEQADVAMAPAADMFEMGVKLQVLRRGTLFPMRARKLWELYRAHPSLEALPAPVAKQLEETVFAIPLSQVWSQTRAFWQDRDPAQIERAQADPKHKMALCFRWYLGQSSRWANTGNPERVADYQVWCGPSMGAFNEWTRGSFLENWTARRVVIVNLNLLHAAAVLTRAQILAAQGVTLPPAALDIRPRPLAELEEFAL